MDAVVQRATAGRAEHEVRRGAGAVQAAVAHQAADRRRKAPADRPVGQHAVDEALRRDAGVGEVEAGAEPAEVQVDRRQADHRIARLPGAAVGHQRAVEGERAGAGRADGVMRAGTRRAGDAEVDRGRDGLGGGRGASAAARAAASMPLAMAWLRQGLMVGVLVGLIRPPVSRRTHAAASPVGAISACPTGHRRLGSAGASRPMRRRGARRMARTCRPNAAARLALLRSSAGPARPRSP